MMGLPPGFRKEKEKFKLPDDPKKIVPFLLKTVTDILGRLLYIFRLVWQSKPWILFVMMGYSVLNGILPLVGAYIGRELINSLVGAVTGETASFSVIMGILLIQFAYLIFTSLVSNIYNIVIRVAGELVTNNIKLQILNKAKEIDLADFDLPEFYEKLENASREAGIRPLSILSSSFGMISTLLSMISFIVILASVSPAAPFIMVLLSIPTAVISFVYRRKNFFYMIRHSKERRQMNYYNEMMVNKDAVKEIRLFNLSDVFIGAYKDTFKKYFTGIKKLVIGEGAWNSGAGLLSAGVNCGLFLMIAKKVYDGVLAVGDYSLYTGALNSISGGVASIISTTALIYEGTLFIDNIIAFMNVEKKIVPALAEPRHVTRRIAHRIEFCGVSFVYPGAARRVLDNVSFTIEAGETVVLVGLNGAGKTTLIKLLTRLYDPVEGVILLDGNDIREYDVTELYNMFGIIFQDFGKYAFTAGENIHFGQVSRECDNDGIKEAARLADADMFIERLPSGYDTPLTRYFEQSGIELSIGQWQKLSIARAFYSDSDFLILDEPTASLDPLAEQEIYHQFESLRHGKTTIFVSHRLSSATTADKIIVLENGRVEEIGSHSELMEHRGKYHEMFSAQASRYITPSGSEGAADGDFLRRPPQAPTQSEMSPPLHDGRSGSPPRTVHENTN